MNKMDNNDKFPELIAGIDKLSAAYEEERKLLNRSKRTNLRNEFGMPLPKRKLKKLAAKKVSAAKKISLNQIAQGLDNAGINLAYFEFLPSKQRNRAKEESSAVKQLLKLGKKPLVAAFLAIVEADELPFEVRLRATFAGKSLRALIKDLKTHGYVL